MYRLVLSVSMLIFLGACSKEGGQVPPPGIPEDSRTNVAYGTDPAQKLDYYLPADRSTANTKVMILVHGGGWSQGDKSDFNSFMDTLKKRLPGYAIFNINYRLAGWTINMFPAQEMDVKAAVEFIYSKRNEYGVSDKFVMLGASAGAHLSLLHAYKYPAPVKIRAVVDFFGPADLVDMYNNPAPLAPPGMLSAVVGGTPVNNPLMYSHSSPVTYVDAQSPPTIILHGGLDPLVLPDQSQGLKNLLESAGVSTEYVFYPAEAHGWVGANMIHSFNRIQSFLTTYVP